MITIDQLRNINKEFVRKQCYRETFEVDQDYDIRVNDVIGRITDEYLWTYPILLTRRKTDIYDDFDVELTTNKQCNKQVAHSFWYDKLSEKQYRKLLTDVLDKYLICIDKCCKAFEEEQNNALISEIEKL